MNVPNRLDFAQEVRAERLSLLWKVTLVAALFLVWGTLILTSLAATNPVDLFIPIVAMVVGCLGCRWLLASGRYESAVWAYALGLIVCLGYMSYTSPSAVPAAGIDPKLALGRSMIPFVFPIVVMIVGFLLPTRDTLIIGGLAILITLVVPRLGVAPTDWNAQFFAVVLIVLAAGVAAQMSGALYGIAEWALESYRKERLIKDQLFDTQQEVQRSFMRQKALADQLQETNNELEGARAAALEAKNFRGQFLANMSHELRTPLNAIIGFSETMLNFPMMYENQPLPPAYKTDLNQIYTSGKHLLALINDILDLSKVDAGKLDLEIESVDLDPIIKGVLATAVGLVGDKPIKLKRDTAGKLPNVKGDSLRIRQVLINLVSNAAKFTDEGVVTVGARDDGNGEVTMWVKDSGIGIAPQDMDKIFEEFRQGSSGRRKGRAGSGLGLAISRQLLQLMGGRVWAESTLGKGSTFYFTLPVYTPEPVEQQG
jgi:signal transduction histidine kinase